MEKFLNYRTPIRRSGILALLFNLFLYVSTFPEKLKIPQEITPYSFLHDLFGNFYILDRTRSTVFKLDSALTIIRETSLNDYAPVVDPVAISLLGLKLAILNQAKNEILFLDKNLSYISSVSLDKDISPIDFDALSNRLFILERKGMYIISYSGKSMKRTHIRVSYNPTNCKIRAKENEKLLLLSTNNYILVFQFDGKLKRKIEIEGLKPIFDFSGNVIACVANDSLIVFEQNGTQLKALPLDDHPIDLAIDRDCVYILFPGYIKVIRYAGEN